MLLEAGAAVDRKDVKGRTALMRACGEGHGSVAQALFEAGATVDLKDANGRTALMLMFASSSDREHAMRVLLKKAGAVVDAADCNRATALCIVACQRLRDGGCCASAAAGGRGSSGLERRQREDGIDARLCGNGNRGMSQVLLEAGAAVDLQDSTGRVALMFASSSDCEHVMRVLLRAAGQK